MIELVLSLLPRTPIELIAAIVGVVFGFLLATSGFDYSGKSEDLGKNSRFLNVKLVVFGLLGTFFDWKVLNLGKEVDHTAIVAYYLGYLVAIAAMVIILSALVISFSALFSNYGDVRNRLMVATRLFLIYISFGIKAYLQESRNLDEVARELASRTAALERERTAHSGDLELLAKASRMLIGLMAGVSSYRDVPSELARDQLIDNILDSMIGVVTILARDNTDLVLKANYMVAAPYHEVAPRLPADTLLFTWGDPKRYAYVLILERYAHQAFERSVALPVDSSPLYAGTLLPGAPTAFATDFDLINSADPAFKPGIPKNICADVRKYFSAMDFKSVLSLPLIRGTSRVGVVNIESNREDLIGESRAALRRVEGFLRPYSMLLGILVENGADHG